MNHLENMRGDLDHQPNSANTTNGGGSMSSADFQDVLTHQEDDQQSTVVSPEMLYKLSKKIAQLTKVIYSLNTKNDDLEIDLEQVKNSYEEKLKLCKHQLNLATTNLQQQLGQEDPPDLEIQNGVHGIEGSPGSDADVKRELKKTRLSLKQTEAKMRAMEEEIEEKRYEMELLHRDAAARQTPGHFEQKFNLLEQQLKQVNQEKVEQQLRLDKLDIQKENLRLERDMLKKDLLEMTQDKNGLQLQLSAARIQLNYNREMGYSNSNDQADGSRENDEFVDELIAKIEILTKEKSHLLKELEKSQNGLDRLQREKEEAARKNQSELEGTSLHRKCEAEKSQMVEKISKLEANVKEISESHQTQLELIFEEKKEAVALVTKRYEEELDELRRRLEQDRGSRDEEMMLQSSKISELKQKCDDKDNSCKEAESKLATCQEELQQSIENARALENQLATALASAASLRDCEENLREELSQIRDRELTWKQEMGQNSERLCTAEEKCNSAEKDRDEWKRKCIELEAKMDVMKKAVTRDADEKVKQLERALEEALIEREEILEACEKEIQHERTICIQTEQKMMDDFEWKLREIEAEYRAKIRDTEETARTSQMEYARMKDDEFTKLGISLRREMEEKMRQERCNLKSALDAQHKSKLDSALEHERAESRRELRVLQNSWDDEKSRLEREVRALKRRIEDLENEARKRKNDLDSRLQEDKKKSELIEHLRQEIEQVRHESEDRLENMRSRHEQEKSEYESRLSAANDNRMAAMFQMREEVELEFTDRMEQLRSMYLVEIENQTKKMEDEKARASQIEISLRKLVDEKQLEAYDLNQYYQQQSEDYEAKINDLLTRLQEQTALAVKLQNEIDSYEWYEEDEEEEETKPASPRRPPSRPASTRPVETQQLPVTPSTTENQLSPELNDRIETPSPASAYATPNPITRPGATQTPDSLRSFSSVESGGPLVPEPPPRASSAANRKSWAQDPSSDSTQPQQTLEQNPELNELADRETGDGSTLDPPRFDENPYEITNSLGDHPIPISALYESDSSDKISSHQKEGSAEDELELRRLIEHNEDGNSLEEDVSVEKKFVADILSCKDGLHPVPPFDEKPLARQAHQGNDENGGSYTSNPTVEIEPVDESNEDPGQTTSTKLASRSNLSTFFHQKLLRSPSASSTALTNSSSSSSPETKCV